MREEALITDINQKLRSVFIILVSILQDSHKSGLFIRSRYRVIIFPTGV